MGTARVRCVECVKRGAATWVVTADSTRRLCVWDVSDLVASCRSDVDDDDQYEEEDADMVADEDDLDERVLGQSETQFMDEDADERTVSDMLYHRETSARITCMA